MFTIIIQEKGGEQRRMVFNKAEVTIGRVQGNDIVLPKGNVSKRHARIVLKDGKFIIVDLKSTNGTYVNGRKITSPLVVKDSDKIYIGDFIVGVDESAIGEADGPSDTTTAPPGSADRMPDARPPRPTEAAPSPMPMSMAPPIDPPMTAPSPAQPPSRTQPPRPPGPSREMPAREPLAQREPLAPREPLSPMGARDPLGGREPLGARDPHGPMSARDREPMNREPLGREPGVMPPISAPPPNRVGRPGGTMPPPIAPLPPREVPHTPPPPDPHFPSTHGPASGPHSAQQSSGMPPAGPIGVSAAPAPAFPAAAPPPPSPVAPITSGAPAPVVPLTSDKNKARQLVGQGVKKLVGRPPSVPSKRGVQLEPLDPKIVKMLDLQSNILERLRAKLDLDKVPTERLHEEELWQKAERATIDLVETLESSGELPKYIDQDTLIKETLNEALALGPLEDMFADEAIDEIVIDRRDRVVVGKNGVLKGSGKAFSSDDVFERVVKRLVAEAGGVIDETHPVVDMRMRDGTRLTAAVPPVAARSACLVLKKPSSQTPTLGDLVQQNVLSSGMADFLATCIAARRNIVVCGAPGSGKTQLLGALAAASPAGERVVSIEEIAELAIARDEWVQLETRPGNGKQDDVDLGTLLDAALRMLPDRLVIGEVRGQEAIDVVHALTSSVDGALVAITGDGASSVLNRVATLARVGSGGTSDAAIRELVGHAFEIVLCVARSTDGSIKVQSIEEITGVSDAVYETQIVFQHRDGSFVATGAVPRFYTELEARGIPADQAVFR